MTPFQKALLHSVAEQFNDIPTENGIAAPPHFCKKQHPIRRFTIAAAVLALLIGTVVAAKLFPDWGEPELSQFSVTMDDGSANAHISMEFEEAFVSPDAPAHIETFYLPEIPIEDIRAENTFVSSATGTYYPFRNVDSPDNVMPDGDIIDLNFEWYMGENIVSYSQRALKSGKLNGINWVYGNQADPKYTTETLTIDGYDVFCVAIEAYDSTTYNWFWSDGGYLFGLCSSVEDMSDLLRTIRPVEDMAPYLGNP